MTKSRSDPQNAVITLRDYGPSDLDALCELDRLCFGEPFRFTRKAMLHFVTAPQASTVLAENQYGQLAGFLVTHYNSSAYIVTLDVAPSYRRRGIATLLLTSAECSSASRGYNHLRLHVHSRNLSAILFYQAKSFCRKALAVNFYGQGLDACLYEKILPNRDALH